jgi:hypothetical protein
MIFLYFLFHPLLSFAAFSSAYLFFCTPEDSNPMHNLGLISNLMHKIPIYLHIIHLLKSSTCFEHCPAHLQEVYVVIVYMHPLVSSLSAGNCLVHRLRKKWLSYFLTGAQDSHLQRVTIPEAAYIQLRRRPPDDEQGNARNM